MLLDGVVQRLTKGELSYDKDGALAAEGRVHSDLLAELMRHPFIRKAPPKSTGREEFGNAFLDKILGIAQKKGLSMEDLLATLTAVTVETIVENSRLFLGEFTELIASGGGAKNRTLMHGLRERLVGGKGHNHSGVRHPGRGQGGAGVCHPGLSDPEPPAEQCSCRHRGQKGRSVRKDNPGR